MKFGGAITAKGHDFLGEMEMFQILNKVVIMWQYTLVNTHNSFEIYSSYVWFIVWNLHLWKLVKKSGQRKNNIRWD